MTNEKNSTLNVEKKQGELPNPVSSPPLGDSNSEYMSEVNEIQEMTPEQKRALIGVIVAVIILILAIVGGVVALAVSPPEVTAKVRDIFIILMAILSLLIGLALVILMVQLARLTNLLQNELRPIIDSMNETISHLRGTSIFLSDNLAEPVIKLNEYLAGLSQLLNVTGLRKKTSKSKTKTTKGE
jgi:hypothetical protein